MDTRTNYTLKSGFKEMDFDKVAMMLKDAHWCLGIKKEKL